MVRPRHPSPSLLLLSASTIKVPMTKLSATFIHSIPWPNLPIILPQSLVHTTKHTRPRPRAETHSNGTNARPATPNSSSQTQRYSSAFVLSWSSHGRGTLKSYPILRLSLITRSRNLGQRAAAHEHTARTHGQLQITQSEREKGVYKGRDLPKPPRTTTNSPYLKYGARREEGRACTSYFLPRPDPSSSWPNHLVLGRASPLAPSCAIASPTTP